MPKCMPCYLACLTKCAERQGGKGFKALVKPALLYIKIKTLPFWKGAFSF